MQTRSRKQKNTLEFSHCCEGNHRVSQSQVRIHVAWSVSEGDIFRLYFLYIGYI